VIASTSAAIPEGTLNSARSTRPLPIAKSRIPTTSAEPQALSVGAGVPRRRSNPYSNPPATSRRTEPMTKVGIEAMAKAMAR